MMPRSAGLLVSRTKDKKAIQMPEAHYHDEYEIYYLLHGRVRYFIENKIFELKAGDIALIPPKVIHKTKEHADNNERLLVSFLPTFLGYSPDDVIYSCFRQHYFQNTDLHRIFISIEEAYKKQSAEAERLIRYALEYTLMKLSTANVARQETAGKNTQVLDAVTYINANFGENLSLPFLAKKFAMSESHFSRTFKESISIGLCEYINLVRIQNAERMLRRSRRSVTEIAEACGFHDSSYFTAVFRQITGTTPLKYRKT